MTVRALLLIPAALACLAAAPPPKGAPAKPAAKAAAPKAATVKPSTGPFDPQNPQGLIDLITAAGGKTQAPRRDADAVFVAVSAPAANFSVQFAGCNAQGRGCQAVLFDSLLDGGSPTLAQMNSFNQTSVVCRLYQDKAGKPHATYATLLMKTDTRDGAALHLAAWRGCLAEASAFLKDPVAYLANAA